MSNVCYIWSLSRLVLVVSLQFVVSLVFLSRVCYIIRKTHEISREQKITRQEYLQRHPLQSSCYSKPKVQPWFVLYTILLNASRLSVLSRITGHFFTLKISFCYASPSLYLEWSSSVTRFVTMNTRRLFPRGIKTCMNLVCRTLIDLTS